MHGGRAHFQRKVSAQSCSNDAKQRRKMRAATAPPSWVRRHPGRLRPGRPVGAGSFRPSRKLLSSKKEPLLRVPDFDSRAVFLSRGETSNTRKESAHHLHASSNRFSVRRHLYSARPHRRQSTGRTTSRLAGSPSTSRKLRATRVPTGLRATHVSASVGFAPVSAGALPFRLRNACLPLCCRTHSGELHVRGESWLRESHCVWPFLWSGKPDGGGIVGSAACGSSGCARQDEGQLALCRDGHGRVHSKR
jgi:hypothetical protein